MSLLFVMVSYEFYDFSVLGPTSIKLFLFPLSSKKFLKVHKTRTNSKCLSLFEEKC